MQTSRLSLRQRTPEHLNDVLNRPLAEQLAFFGFASAELLQPELKRINDRQAGNFAKYIKWDLLEKNGNRVVGNCGFHNWLPEHERAEIGYLLHTPYWGQGFMTEALQKVIEYGFEEMKLNRIEAFIGPDNLPSQNVVTRLGFTHEGILRQHYKFNDRIYDSLVYSLLKSEWKK